MCPNGAVTAHMKEQAEGHIPQVLSFKEWGKVHEVFDGSNLLKAYHYIMDCIEGKTGLKSEERSQLRAQAYNDYVEMSVAPILRQGRPRKNPIQGSNSNMSYGELSRGRQRAEQVFGKKALETLKSDPAGVYVADLAEHGAVGGLATGSGEKALSDTEREGLIKHGGFAAPYILDFLEGSESIGTE